MNSAPIPPAMREEINSHPLSGMCWRKLALRDHECRGRLTWEHAIQHAGKRVNEVWALVRLCEYSHSLGQFLDTGIMCKPINEWIALSRITDWEATERKYPRTSWRQRLKYLTGLYGRLSLPEES